VTSYTEDLIQPEIGVSFPGREQDHTLPITVLIHANLEKCSQRHAESKKDK